MSGTGDGQDTDEKFDLSRLNPGQSSALAQFLPQSVSSFTQQISVKPTLTRSIAPASTVVTQATQQLSASGIGVFGAQILRYDLPRIPIMGNMQDSSVNNPGQPGHGIQTALTSQATTIATPVLTPQAVSVTPTNPILHAQALAQQNMASLIRGVAIPQASQPQVLVGCPPQPAAPTVQAFAPHIPRGATNAATALAAPKVPTALPVLRASQLTSQNIGSCGSVAPTLTPTRAFLTVRPATPLATHPEGQNVAQLQETQRPFITQQQPTSTAPGTAQITIQNPRIVQDASQQSLTGLSASKPPNIHQLSREQTIVMSQPSVNIQPIATTVALAQQKSKDQVSELTPQIIRSSRPPVSITQSMVTSSVIPVITMTKTGSIPPTALNLSQNRLPKVMMSQISMPGTVSQPSISMAKPGNIQLPFQYATTAPSASSLISLPVAEVTPQRHPAVAPVVGGLHASQTMSQEVSTQLQSSQPVVTYTQAQQPTQIHGKGVGMCVTSKTPVSVTETGSTNASTIVRQQEVGTHERPALPAMSPYAVSDFHYTPSAPQAVLANYPNLLLQQHSVIPQTTAFPSLQPGANIRASSGNTGNLVTTIKAAAPQGMAVTTTSQTVGVRLNPMVVAVDPRQAALSEHLAQELEARQGAGGEMLVASSAKSGLQTIAAVSSMAQSAANQMPSVSLASSPRPSILRKRTNEGVAVAKKNLAAALGGDMMMNSASTDIRSTILPQAATPTKHEPYDGSRENSQSSTDTATSNESTPTSLPSSEIKIKQEPSENLENGTPVTAVHVLQSNNINNAVDESPRKRPRKQLLNATEELRDGDSTDEELENINARMNLSKELQSVKTEELQEFVDDEGVRWVPEKKRPNISLLSHFQGTWKSKNNHFHRYSDVKPKKKKVPTVNELSNQKSIVQKASGWKLYHLAAQLEEIMDLEKDVVEQMTSLQDEIAPKHIAKHTMEDDIGMVHELTQGTIQRAKLLQDQVRDARKNMLKILDNKQRIVEIINKHHSKRPVKKKERT